MFLVNILKNMQIFAYFWRRNLPNFKFDCIVLRTCPQNLLNWSRRSCQKFPFSEVLAQGCLSSDSAENSRTYCKLGFPMSIFYVKMNKNIPVYWGVSQDWGAPKRKRKPWCWCDTWIWSLFLCDTQYVILHTFRFVDHYKRKTMIKQQWHIVNIA